MAKYRLLAGVLFVLSAMACTPRNEGFTVRGEFTDATEDFQLMVSENIPEMKSWFIDTIDVINGKFTYTGKLEHPEMMVFSLMQGENFLGSFGVLMDNSNVTIAGSVKDLSSVKIEGCKVNDAFVRIMKEGEAVFEKFNQLQVKRSEALKTDKQLYAALAKDYDAAYEKIKEHVLSAENYSTNRAIPYIIFSNFNVTRPAMLEELLTALDSSLYDDPYIKHLSADLAREKKVGVGSMAFDFELPDVKGNMFKLSDYRGKYVLIEFTASWCGWCKKEIPYLQQLYKETKGKNLEMLTIYVDKDRNMWLNDMKEHPLPWTVLCDLKALDGPVPKGYNVHGIPAIFLIAPDGTIKAKGLRGEYMIKTVKELLDK